MWVVEAQEELEKVASTEDEQGREVVLPTSKTQKKETIVKEIYIHITSGRRVYIARA
jgi:hypothetical protein